MNTNGYIKYFSIYASPGDNSYYVYNNNLINYIYQM